MNPVTQAAIEAVGPDRPTDSKLEPSSHLASLQNARMSAPLVRILQRPELMQIIDAYESADTAAQTAQTLYKRAARLAAISGFGAISIGSVMLLPSSALFSEMAKTIGAGAQLTCLAISFLASLWLGWRKPFNTWMQHRAEAETQRIRLFRRVTEATEQVQDGELPLLPLQLEYFRRYQLDVQRLYYDQRGTEHRRAVHRRLIWRALALLLILTAALPVFWTLQGKEWVPSYLAPLAAGIPEKSELAQRLFLCLGLIGGALQGLLAAYSLISYDERNGARYHDTWRNLEDLATRPLDEARNAAVQGNQDRMLTFIALVHEQISSEHREWVSLRSMAPELSLDRLRENALPRLR